jgi:hypothetical protein
MLRVLEAREYKMTEIKRQRMTDEAELRRWLFQRQRCKKAEKVEDDPVNKI